MSSSDDLPWHTEGRKATWSALLFFQRVNDQGERHIADAVGGRHLGIAGAHLAHPTSGAIHFGGLALALAVDRLVLLNQAGHSPGPTRCSHGSAAVMA